jgi:hypothetical protein
MMAIDYSNETYVCLFCKNGQNYGNFPADEKALRKFALKRLPALRKEVEKDHLLEAKAFSRCNFYVPQIGDHVVYFYQGHERFHQSNNCFFYSGHQPKMGSTDLPWMRQP